MHNPPFAPGTKVLCSYRLPSLAQHWLHLPHLGIVREPSDDVAAWNGYNSERQYCQTLGSSRVEYAFGVQHDQNSSLSVATLEDERVIARWFDPTLSTAERAAFLARHEHVAESAVA